MNCPISNEEGLAMLLGGNSGAPTTANNPPDIDQLQQLLERMLRNCDPRTCYEIARAHREARLSLETLDEQEGMDDYEEPDDLDDQIGDFLNGLPLLQESRAALATLVNDSLAALDWTAVLHTMQAGRIAQHMLIHEGAIGYDGDNPISATISIHEMTFTASASSAEEALTKVLLICQTSAPELNIL